MFVQFYSYTISGVVFDGIYCYCFDFRQTLNFNNTVLPVIWLNEVGIAFKMYAILL